MNRNDVVSIGRAYGAWLKVLWRGLARMMVGTGTAGMLALSVYGYAMIPEEGGYVAVSEFLIATALLATAIGCLYAMGAGKKKGAKK